MPNLKATITGFDNFCKAGSKMLLDLHHDFADLRGNLVREAGAITMPKEQKPTQPNTTAAAKEAVARVPDHPLLNDAGEFYPWAAARVAQTNADRETRTDEILTRGREDMTKRLRAAPSSVLGIA